jgi:hypothetical protein
LREGDGGFELSAVVVLRLGMSTVRILLKSRLDVNFFFWSADISSAIYQNSEALLVQFHVTQN